MDFTPAPAKTSSAPTAKVDDEVVKDFIEAHEWLKANPGAQLHTPEFPDEAARDKWVRQCQAHAARNGLRFRVVRDDLLKAEKPLAIRFAIEDEGEKVRRAEERALKAAEVAARRAAGEVVKSGHRKTA